MNAKAYLKKHWLWIIVNFIALVPLAKLLWDFVNGYLIDPIGELTNVTGYVGLILLVLSLAITPLISVTGFRKAATVRKSLGMQGFLYVSLHLFVFVVLDYGLNFELIFGDSLLSKRYVLFGFSAFLLLVPLAITSTRGWMKRLGKNWKRLHRLIYLAVPLGVIHFILIEKVPVEPVIWALVVGLLLVARIPSVRKRLTAFQKLLDRTKEKKGAVNPASA